MNNRIGMAMLIMAIVLIGLKITKPSMDGFVQFARGEQLRPENMGARYSCNESANLFVYSFYEIVEERGQGLDFVDQHKKYLGILGHYFQIGSYQTKEGS